MIELAPSILSADFARLAEQIRAAVAGGGSVIHVDIMDGHFVPNITVGPPVVRSLRKVTEVPLDCHLMIENPDDFIPPFAEAGASWISESVSFSLRVGVELRRRAAFSKMSARKTCGPTEKLRVAASLHSPLERRCSMTHAALSPEGSLALCR